MEPTWLDYVTALGAIATPVLVLALTGIGWRIRSRLERHAALEDKLRDDRIATYNAILEPFIVLLTSDAAWDSDPKKRGKTKQETAQRTLISLDYRKQGFRMSLVGTDAVVRSYNELMQYFYARADVASGANEVDAKEMLELLGQFLLEIRRSMGNEATKLTNWDMIEWWMSDARKLRSASADAPIRRLQD
jgi:hypothetical protein